jgi:hypothetical protein
LTNAEKCSAVKDDKDDKEVLATLHLFYIELKLEP